MKPCLDCGKPGQASRCTDCTRRKEASRIRPTEARNKLYNRKHRRLAAYVRATATTCWVCGQGARDGDPWQADHVLPGDPGSPLLPAHRSCNIARANASRV